MTLERYRARVYLPRMNRTVALLLTLLFSFLITAAQELPVYGELAEMKEARRVYVTADYADARERILKELKKYDGLEVVSAPDGADFILAYAVKSETEAGIVSQLTAYTKTSEGRQRILWQQEQSYESRLNKPNSINLVRRFITAVKKLRAQ